MKKEKNIKPKFDLELQMEVKGITNLENNMSDIKDMALGLKEYYTNTKFIEDGTELDFENKEQMELIEAKKKEAADEKAKINKFKTSINEKSKEALEIYEKPIAPFKNLKKETVDILSEVYNFINEQVELVNNQLLNEKIRKLKNYFNEKIEQETINFIDYERMNQNVTLSASMKSLKVDIDDYVQKIVDELKLIDTQDHKTEILIEYKSNLNVASAITTVNERIKAIEEIKRKEEEKRVAAQQVEENIQRVETVVLSTPQKVSILVEKEEVFIESTEEETITTQFTVKHTMSKIVELKKFLKAGGYEYE